MPEALEGIAAGVNKNNMDQDKFEDLVASVFEALPEPFTSALDGVAVIVEDWPDADLMRELGLAEDETLFGLYDGVPLTSPDRGSNMTLPDRIFIFQGPIEEVCDSEAEIAEEIRKTVLHEVGHFFGLSEEQVDHL